MTLLLGEVRQWKNVADGRNVDGMVGEQCLTSVDGASGDDIGYSMALCMKLFVLHVKILIHANMKAKNFVGLGVGFGNDYLGRAGVWTGESDRVRLIVGRMWFSGGLELPRQEVNFRF